MVENWTTNEDTNVSVIEMIYLTLVGYFKDVFIRKKYKHQPLKIPEMPWIFDFFV